jgi:hypothetical protein
MKTNRWRNAVLLGLARGTNLGNRIRIFQIIVEAFSGCQSALLS